MTRFAALLSALVLALPGPALAGQSERPLRATIVYTGMNVGIHSTWSTLNEAEPLYDPRTRGDLEAEGLSYDVGTLKRDGWYVWGAAAPLTAKAAKELFEGDGLTVEGPGQAVPALVSDYAVVFQQPDGDSAWLVPWLDARLKDKGETPDVRATRGTLFRAKSRGGTEVWLFAEQAPPAACTVLRDTAGWYWVGSARSTVRRGKRASQLVSLARRFGGEPLIAAARRLADERNALRVDAGGLVDNANDLLAESALEDTLAAVPAMRLDALVPFKYELWLPPEKLARLAASAPLVSANLKGPPEIPIKPYVIREVNDLRIAIIGISDKTTLAQYGLLGTRTGWSADDPEKALRKALAEVRLDDPDAVLLVTNVADERLGPLRDACLRCAAVITNRAYHNWWSYKQRFEPADPGRGRWPLPWVVTGAGLGHVGVLELEFERPAGGKPQLVGATNEGRVVRDDAPAGASERWRDFQIVSDFVEARRDLVLPDVRRVAARDKRIVTPEGEPLAILSAKQWSLLAAAALRQGSGAEVAVIHSLHGGSHIVGDIQRFIAEEWLPNGIGVATAQLTGAEIKRLLATDPDRRKLTVAGYDPESGRVGGRYLVDAERYLVVTADTLASNENFENVFHGQARVALKLRGDRILPGRPGDRVSIRDAVMARLDALKAAHGGFGDAYLDDFARLLTDDGQLFEPRWLVALKPCEGTYQQLTVTNRESFGEVRNSRINTPNNVAVRGRGNLGLTYETADLDWENKSLLEYQRAEFHVAGAPSIVQEAADNVQLTSEFRLKVFKLQTPRSALELVPFVSGNYLTEFTPTTDPKTNLENARRQELNGILGVVLYPRTWLKEARLGAIAKNDLVATRGGFEPGVQLAGSLEVPIGAFSWAFDADLKNYFRTPEDTADDLGLIAQVGTGLRFPLFGGFALRVGVDATYFTGKLSATPPVGSAIVPTVGLTYNATWKPAVGLVY
ncbi:MAG: hypothetical protein FJZ01_19780 [Candidatus Sericytochromatia bacterium]|nr:hypothetical protein [Candidatus Tanganyikabacteria bacterium]